MKRAQAERENEKVKNGDPERNFSRGKLRNSERERVSEREAEREPEKVRGRELERNQNRGKERNSEHERVLHREAERETEKVKDRELERNHNRGKERNPERERASDREKVVDRERGRERGMEREISGEKRERQSGRDQTNGKSSRRRYEHSTSPSDLHQRRKHRSRSPLPGYDTRNGEEVMNSRGSDQRNGNDDSVAKMNAAEVALQAKQKQQPSFELSGKLAEETNRVRGVTLLFNEPPEARKPDIRWRLYVFKAGEVLNEPLYIHRQSCYLFGRERRVADIPTDHPSCSKQHAVIQFRLMEKEQPDGMTSKQVRPYLMDLGSTNKTYLNDNPIEPQRYHELFEKDTIKFGNSSREYVLLHENSVH